MLNETWDDETEIQVGPLSLEISNEKNKNAKQRKEVAEP